MGFHLKVFQTDVLEVEPEQIKQLDEKVIFSNNTLNDNSNLIENYYSNVNHYVIDPKIEKLYEDQIALLKRQNEMLETKIVAMEKGKRS